MQPAKRNSDLQTENYWPNWWHCCRWLSSTSARGRETFHCPYVRYLAASMIERALCEGWIIDRTNADGPVAEWDGWLVIESPKRAFLQIAGSGGKALT